MTGMRTPLSPHDAAALRSIIDHLGPKIFVALADPDGTLLIVNRPAMGMGSLREEDVIGRRIYETAAFAHSGAVTARTREAVERASRGEPQRFDIELMVSRDRLITVDFAVEPVHDDRGEVIYLVPSCHDVTERVDAEAELRRQAGHDLRMQRLPRIGTLAGGIAHDLNNVLAPIVMSIDLLRESVTSGEDRELLETIATSARRGADMVRHILSLERGVQAERTSVQPRALLDDVEKIARDTFPDDIEVRAECEGEPWPILGDKTQIQHVLLELCVNARDAMPEGGTLLLRASNVNVDGRPHVRLDVDDSGQANAIERGTGLALSTSLAIVKGHEGSLHVSSSRAAGSRFSAFLPAVPTLASATAESDRVALPRGRGQTILVVDDELSIQRVTQHTLETHGYRVLTATDGAEGLAIYGANRQSIAAVVTDMMMPVMDGASMMDELARLNPALPIIASSGMATLPTDALRARVRAVLAKPYSAETLLVTLRDVLAS